MCTIVLLLIDMKGKVMRHFHIVNNTLLSRHFICDAGIHLQCVYKGSREAMLYVLPDFSLRLAISI